LSVRCSTRPIFPGDHCSARGGAGQKRFPMGYLKTLRCPLERAPAHVIASTVARKKIAKMFHPQACSLFDSLSLREGVFRQERSTCLPLHSRSALARWSQLRPWRAKSLFGTASSTRDSLRRCGCVGVIRSTPLLLHYDGGDLQPSDNRNPVQALSLRPLLL
jgi:hypothetical protein